MKGFYWLSFVFLLPLFVKANEPLKVGLIEGGRAPYFFAKNDTNTGLYKDILLSISELTDIEFSFVYFPQARLRRMMISGRLDIEMGTDPHWRQEANEIDIAIYSEPFMVSQESWVVSAHNKERIEEFISKPDTAKPCIVLGFNIERNMKNANIDVKGNSDLHLIEMLTKKRCDIAIIPNAVLDHFDIFQNDLFATFAAPEQHQLSIRLGKEHQHLMPKINNALRQLKDNGEIVRLMKKYGIKSSH